MTRTLSHRLAVRRALAPLAVVTLTLASGSSVYAQCAPNSPQGGSGPDVIVGELYGAILSYGNSGGYYSYSMGTTSCNIGTQQLDWIAFNNQHPVIAQNLYRYKDRRFEQIAMSWLKQGFTALQQNACACGCVPSGTGARLGIGCSDPYSASLNGSQLPNALSSRSEVFAPHSGTFQYPPVLQPPVTDQTSRRLRPHGTDIDPNLNPGARYFAEGQYVTPDDADAGNAYNNCSYRRVSFGVNPGNFPMLFAGPTQRQQPAIRAWVSEDPSVVLVDAFTDETPHPGRVVVGYNVVDNEDGTFNYEYAIYNQNSTRGIRAFDLPIHPAATITGVGFHDVEYHSGDPFSGADWPGVISASSIRWETETEAQNANANAIRWGTLYNFWFQSTASPVPVTADLDYFRMSGFAGAPTQTTVSVMSPGGTIVDQVAGVLCTNSAAGVSITWDTNPAYTAVDILRDGEALVTLPGTAESYEDLSAEEGERVYSVRGRVGVAYSSAISCTIEVPTSADTRFDLTASSLSVGYDETSGSGPFTVDVTIVEDPGNPAYPNFTAGYSVALANDTARLVPTAIEAGAAAASLNAGTGPSFFMPSLEPHGITAAVVYSFSSTEFLTAETPIEVLRVSYDTNPAFFAGNSDGDTTVLTFVNGQLGPALVDNVVVVSPGISLAPTFTDAVITLVPGLEEFRRGDCNLDAAVDIADPIFLLSVLFPSGTPATAGCDDACDGNNDGSLDIADAIRILGSLFGSPTVPLPAPYPNCGTDPEGGADGLDCADTAACSP